MPTETLSSPINPIINRARNVGSDRMSFFVTQVDLGDSPSREVIEGLRKRMRKLGFGLVGRRGSTYEFYRGGKIVLYRDMIRYILGLSTGSGI